MQAGGRSCSLLGAFILVPLAVAALPLGVLIGSDWCWWSESSSARRRLACGSKAKGDHLVEARVVSVPADVIHDQCPHGLNHVQYGTNINNVYGTYTEIYT